MLAVGKDGVVVLISFLWPILPLFILPLSRRRPEKKTEKKQTNGNTVSHGRFKPLGNFIAGRPKAALLFLFFRDFRCGVLLFMVILVIYKYKNR